MADDVAALFTPPHNYAVVQLPGRQFPGVVVQGDSLAILCEDAARVATLAQGTVAADEAEALSRQLHEVLRSYLSVIAARSIDAPFTYRPPEPSSA